MENNYIKYDGKEYGVLDIIENGTIKYVYLVNIEDPKDFFVRRLNGDSDQTSLDNLSGKEEFAEALKLFSEKHINDIDNL